MNEAEIKVPMGSSNGKLVMVISPSPIYQDNLLNYILDLKFEVAGPFSNVDQAHTFMRKHTPNLIIFDAMTTQSELISFSQLLKNETVDMPVLLLHNGENFTIGHDRIEFIFPPLDPNDIESKLDTLLTKNTDEIDDLKLFIYFINKVLHTLLDLSPEYGKIDIEDIIKNAVNRLQIRNSDITSISEETIRISITDPKQVKIEDLVANFKLMLEEIIDEINTRLDAEWAHSLVEDTLEAVTIELKSLPPPAIEIVEDLGKGYEIIIRKFKHAVPDLDDFHKRTAVAKLMLTDFGPELISIVGDDEELKNTFNESIASQLLTLVGQGSSYHEGIFGPVPIPKTDDVIAVIWSKLINSDIEDQRMKGKTLVIICIAFRKIIVNLIPPNDKLKEIFGEIDNLFHEAEIDEFILQKIADQFKSDLLH